MTANDLIDHSIATGSAATAAWTAGRNADLHDACDETYAEDGYIVFSGRADCEDPESPPWEVRLRPHDSEEAGLADRGASSYSDLGNESVVAAVQAGRVTL